MNYTDLYEKDLCLIQNAIPQIEKLYHKTFFITGASGLIGSSLVDFLVYLNRTNDAGIKLILTSRREETLRKRFGDILGSRDIIICEYDSLQPVRLDVKVDYVIHAASPANPKWYAEMPAETMVSVFMGLYHVLEFARSREASRVLFISTSEVYGKKQDNLPYRSKEYGFLDLLNPRACYPSAKRAGETLCKAYQKEYGIESVIVRPGHIYGPTCTDEDTRASSQFLRQAANGLDIVMKSPGQQKRSYCYTCDCISALLTVLLHGRTDVGYNISNADSICTIREIAECIAKHGGIEVVFENPTDMERSGYNLMDNSSLDSTELQELGWKGLFDLDTGVNHSIQILKGKE